MRFRIISDSDTFTIVFLLIFYCMNVSVLVIQPPGCHNPINVMLCYVMLCYCHAIYGKASSVSFYAYEYANVTFM